MDGIRFEIKGLEPWLQNANKYTLRSIKNAGTSALRAMKTEASRRIRETKGIQAQQMDAVFTLNYPSFSSDPLVWGLTAKAKPVPLLAFGARQTKRGVSVEVTKGKRTIIPHAFIATMQSGHKGVFVRKGSKQIARKGSYVGKARQPIKELFSASVASSLTHARAWVVDRGWAVFTTTFKRLMDARQ